MTRRILCYYNHRSKRPTEVYRIEIPQFCLFPQITSPHRLFYAGGRWRRQCRGRHIVAFPRRALRRRFFGNLDASRQRNAARDERLSAHIQRSFLPLRAQATRGFVYRPLPFRRGSLRTLLLPVSIGFRDRFFRRLSRCGRGYSALRALRRRNFGHRQRNYDTLRRSDRRRGSAGRSVRQAHRNYRRFLRDELQRGAVCRGRSKIGLPRSTP